jgi:hypothetical protein
MKKKHFEKKLALNKTTLTNLDHSRMFRVHGGGVTGTGHNTIDKYCAIYSCGDYCTWTGYPPACPC